MSAPILAIITPQMPWGGSRESTVERSAQTVIVAVADFHLALAQAQTSRDALRIWALLSECMLALGAAEDAALTRADRLCGSPDYQRGA